jgi:hypothetical protein
MRTQQRHIFWFILIRVIAVTSILVAVVIIQSSTSDFIPVIPFYFIVLLAYLLSLVYLGLYLWWDQYTVQAYIQTVVDLFLITALIYISGGLSGSLYLLYIFAVSGSSSMGSISESSLISAPTSTGRGPWASFFLRCSWPGVSFS